VTREKIDTLLEWLDKLGLGTASDGDVVHQLQSARGDALLALVIFGRFLLNPALNLL